jgi:hypothetical protein
MSQSVSPVQNHLNPSSHENNREKEEGRKWQIEAERE